MRIGQIVNGNGLLVGEVDKNVEAASRECRSGWAPTNDQTLISEVHFETKNMFYETSTGFGRQYKKFLGFREILCGTTSM